MKGCLRAMGCMVLLVVITCGSAWATRDWWLPKVGLRVPRQVASAPWEASSEAGARRAENAVIALQSRSGPAFANLTAGDLLSYLLAGYGKEVAKVADSVQASVVGERVYVRASVVTSKIPKDVLGPLRFVMSDRTRVTLGGTMRVIEPGTSELQVKDAMVGSVRVPSAAIPTLLSQLSVERKTRTAPDGFEFPTPKYIGDVRIANGRITVYKAVPTKK